MQKYKVTLYLEINMFITILYLWILVVNDAKNNEFTKLQWFSIIIISLCFIWIQSKTVNEVNVILLFKKNIIDEEVIETQENNFKHFNIILMYTINYFSILFSIKK